MLAFATRTWDGWDYIPGAWDDWLALPDGVLLVATARHGPSGERPIDADGRPLAADVAIAMTHLLRLSDTEMWLEGIRVDPRVRGMSVASDLQVAELAWTRAHGCAVIRYVTGEQNEGSHRLGARHGLRHTRTWRRYERPTPEGAAVHHWGHGDEAEQKLRALRARLLRELAEEKLVLPPDAPDELVTAIWRRVTEDPLFAANGELYESVGWAWQKLTEERFRRHVARGEVLVLDDGVAGAGGGWGLLLLSGTESFNDGAITPALALGDGRPMLHLVARLEGASDSRVRLRFPDPLPPQSPDRSAALVQAGFEPGEHTLHLLERALDPSEPLPEPHRPGMLELTDEPHERAVAHSLDDL
ncbi:MAG: hypothetical protein H0V12_06950 [Chloroflexi bacterium]|nr:hypothetical protein [Chloroflexota bacterium]